MGNKKKGSGYASNDPTTKAWSDVYGNADKIELQPSKKAKSFSW